MPIWLGLLVAPLLALADQSVSYSAIGWACAHQLGFAVHVLHGLFFLAVVAATLAAWQSWRATSRPDGSDETLARRHFLATLATASGALSALVIVAMWFPTWVIAPCFN